MKLVKAKLIWIPLLLILVMGCSDDRQKDQGKLEPAKPQVTEQELNLDVSAAINEESTELQALAEEKALLPDLFTDSEDKKSRISGKPILNHPEDSLQPQVEGAEIKVEIPTQ